MTGFFITGTDTGVGKTLVGAVIARGLRIRKFDVGVFKPLQSGGTETASGRKVTDISILKKASGSRDPVNVVSPYRFREELAPITILRRKGLQVSMDRILGSYMILKDSHDIVMVEGVGGIAVPLWEDVMTKDLIKTLDLPVVIVARAGLGTINHTLLTKSYLSRFGIETLGVVLNQTSEPDGSEEDNPSLMEKYGGVDILGTVPLETSLKSRPDPDMKTLDRLADGLDMERLIEKLGI